MNTIDIERGADIGALLQTAQLAQTEQGRLLAAIRMPANASGFILEAGQSPELAAELEAAASTVGRLAICIDMQQLSQITEPLLPTEATLVAAGTSAVDLAAMWQRPMLRQTIVCSDNRVNRDQRRLEAETIEVDNAVCLFDDVAVSGLNLATAARAIKSTGPIDAVVGLSYASKTMRRLVANAGVERLTEVVRYSRAGGGRPPLNSVRTLQARPAVRHSVAERYFGAATALDFVGDTK